MKEKYLHSEADILRMEESALQTMIKLEINKRNLVAFETLKCNYATLVKCRKLFSTSNENKRFRSNKISYYNEEILQGFMKKPTLRGTEEEGEYLIDERLRTISFQNYIEDFSNWKFTKQLLFHATLPFTEQVINTFFDVLEEQELLDDFYRPSQEFMMDFFLLNTKCNTLTNFPRTTKRKKDFKENQTRNRTSRNSWCYDLDVMKLVFKKTLFKDDNIEGDQLQHFARAIDSHTKHLHKKFELKRGVYTEEECDFFNLLKSMCLDDRFPNVWDIIKDFQGC